MALSAVVALVVLLIIVLGLATLALTTFRSGSHSARVRALQSLAESGIQYGYWQYRYNSAALPYSNTRPFGTGSFSVNVTDNSANINATILVTSTATINNETWKSQRVYAQVGIVGLFNTGLDDNGVALADSAVDPHYTIALNPSGGPTAYVTMQIWPIPPWIYDTTTSKWISPVANESAGSDQPGNYTYKTTFNVIGDPARVFISGFFAADNGINWVKLNGVTVITGNDPSFTSYSSFSINSGFVTGTNTLQFSVHNDSNSPNPSGFRCEMTPGKM